MGAHRLGQDEQYLTVREILSEASTPVPPQAGLSRERSDFYRFGYAILGFRQDCHLIVVGKWFYSYWHSTVEDFPVGTVVAN